ncbi:hypothetical protein GCM10018952_35610 [Streptosporangium vulgare]
MLRRARSATPPAVLCVGTLSVDLNRREAGLDGAPLTLTRREFDLLAYLAARADRVVSRKELLTEVWAAVLRGRPDDRRPPVLAAAQARRRAPPPPATCTPYAAWGSC